VDAGQTGAANRRVGLLDILDQVQVINEQNEDIGKIDDFIIGRDRVLFVILEVGAGIATLMRDG
jgi:hypothetical protein